MVGTSAPKNRTGRADRTKIGTTGPAAVRPTAAQRRWLARGLEEPGGKLPLFDTDGSEISPRTIKSCIRKGWAEPWFQNPIKPDWLVCKLTEQGRALLTRRGTVKGKPA